MRKYDKEFFSIIFHFIIYKEPSTHDRKLFLSVYSLLLYHFALHRLIYMCYCRGPTTTARSCTKTLPLIMYGMYTALTKLNSSVCFLSHRIAIVHSITIPSSKTTITFYYVCKICTRFHSGTKTYPLVRSTHENSSTNNWCDEKSMVD